MAKRKLTLQNLCAYLSAWEKEDLQFAKQNIKHTQKELKKGKITVAMLGSRNTYRLFKKAELLAEVREAIKGEFK